jgi:hypothetical protein
LSDCAREKRLVVTRRLPIVGEPFREVIQNVGDSAGSGGQRTEV